DRVAGARLALEHGADVAVLDDGFQHRRLARRLDLVLLDASDPFGGGRLLPAGRLREPLGGLRRADLILVTRDPDAATLAAVERRVRAAGAGAPLLAAGHRRAGFVDPRGAAAAAPAQALAFCGIGNPARFRADLEEAGIRLLDFVAFADHHRYARGELAGLERRARASGAVLVTTEKDLARLDEPLVAALDPSPLALRIEARIPQEPLLLDSVAAALAPGAGVP
ncbi:MAG: tetraacyldisaccharide 4'-kinase, partial [Candidatus Eiseniibacteriota bacterium]